MHEDSARGTNVVLGPQQLACYIHVDDGVVISEGSPKPPRSDAWIELAAEALEALGFKVPDRQRDQELLKVVGYEPERHPARLRM